MISKNSFPGALIGWLIFSLSCLQAQGVATARISGTLTDNSGGVLAGASVQAIELATGVSRSATTDRAGQFSIPDLEIGSYSIKASAPRMETVVRSGVALTVGASLVLDFTLQVGSASENILVDAEVSRVETQTATVSSLVSSEQVHDLPLNGRNFEQLISLTPGVSLFPAAVEHAVIGVPSDPIYGNENNYSISGSRPEGTAFLLDNTDIADFFNHGTGSGVTGTALGVDAVAEFQILTNTYGAQFGGSGGVVNIASRSGTNHYHGSAYEYLRNNDLDSRGYFDVNPNGQPASAPPYRRNQFGGSVGGPVRKDKLFFFANYEGLRSSLGQTKSRTCQSLTC